MENMNHLTRSSYASFKISKCKDTNFPRIRKYLRNLVHFSAYLQHDLSPSAEYCPLLSSGNKVDTRKMSPSDIEQDTFKLLSRGVRDSSIVLPTHSTGYLQVVTLDKARNIPCVIPNIVKGIPALQTSSSSQIVYSSLQKFFITASGRTCAIFASIVSSD